MRLKYDESGLVPAIVQDADTLQVLQLAYMNELALQTTIEKRLVTFWSRSRQELWTKGETSGNTLELVSIEYDCDEDALLVKARLNGVGVCHTGARSDWFRTLPISRVTLPDGTAADYPETRASDHVDVLHGTGVPDPYRWLEDLDADETAAWVTAQNELTQRYLAQVPDRDAIRDRLTALWNFERFGIPFRRGERLFYTRNDGLQNQAVLYALDAGGGERVLLDPNSWTDDGTAALTGLAPSDDGRLLAYGTSVAGSDWQEWNVLDVGSAADTGDLLRWVKFSGASFTSDGTKLYYSRYDEPTGGPEQVNYFQKLWCHAIGTSQDADVLVYERPDHKDWMFHGQVTEDGRWLAIHVSRGTDPRNCLFVKDLSVPGAPVVELLPDFQAEFELVGNDGDVLYVVTDLEAPRRRIVTIDVREPSRERWREIVPEAGDTLAGVSFVGDRLVCEYLQDAASRVLVHSLDGTLEHELGLPGIGTVTGFTGRRTSTDTFYAFTNATTPPTVYRYDLETGTSEVFRRPDVGFDPGDYETTRVFVTSPDGTRFPMFVSYRKGITLDGTNPTLLYAYGGFRVPMTPQFGTGDLAWMERGGVFAQACLRGGGEYGEDWHLAGTKERKQNVFDDFAAAARWLAEHGYATREHLAIEGGSNGGLLVGASLTQHPELFGAAHAAVGVMDVLRFHEFTIGWAWTSDYGDPSDAEDFTVLLAYSPLHNLRPGAQYPPTIVTTADHDDRVWPGHSFKFAAAMQAAQGGPAPVLARIETRAGHGAGKPTSKQIEEIADVHAFLWSFVDR